MNRIHRVVWSQSRKSFVVAGEAAKAKGKPCSSTRKNVASAVAIALAALAAEPASAQSSCPATSISISGAETSVCTLADGNALTIGSSGSITVAAPAAVVIGNTVSSGSITNNGTISNTGLGISLDSASFTGSITNNAGGQISSTGFNAIQLTNSSMIGGITNNAGGTINASNNGIIFHHTAMSGVIDNSGTITAIGGAIHLNAATGGGVLGSTIGGISNSGTIHGGSSGINIATNSTVSGSITNSGTISGDTGHGIYLSGSAINRGIVNTGNITGGSGGIIVSWASTLLGGISNSGTISGAGSAGIYVGRNSTFSGGIVNSGTILGSTPGGIRVRIDTTLGGGITNSGTIRANNNGAGISVTQNAIIGKVVNSGTISGDTYAINVDGTSTISSIDITGSAARFVGDVYSQASDVVVKAGASFANDNAFDVKSFTVENAATFNMGVGPKLGVANAGITVTNGLSNAGTLAVAEGTAPTITGNYSQASTGVLNIEASGTGSYGQLAVSQTANLAGKAYVNVSAVNTLANGQTLASVISATTLNGNFASVGDNSLAYNFVPQTIGQQIDLTVQATGMTTLVNAVASSAPQNLGAASVLDGLLVNGTSNPAMQTVLDMISASATATEATDTVTQTLPLLTGGSSVAASAALTGINRVVQARIESNRGLSSGDSFYSDKKFWMKPFGSWADQDDRKGVSGFSARTGGLAFGADATISDQARLGVAFAYAKSSVDGNSSVAPNSAKVDIYQLVGYGSYALDQNTEINFQAGIGQNKNNGRRNILFAGTAAKADYNSLTATLGAGIGRTYRLNDQSSFTPSVRADYSWIKDQGYTETGAGALNLNVNGRTTDELILAIDGKLTHTLKSGMTVTANLGLGFDALNQQASITATFAGAPGAAFTTKGLDPSPWVLRGGIGVTSTMQSGMEVLARYDLDHRSDFLNQTASVKLRWAF